MREFAPDIAATICVIASACSFWLGMICQRQISERSGKQPQIVRYPVAFEGNYFIKRVRDGVWNGYSALNGIPDTKPVFTCPTRQGAVNMAKWLTEFKVPVA